MEKITIRKIAEMSDEEVFSLSVPRPHRPFGTGEQRGFLLLAQNFENKEEMAACLYVLMIRLGKINKE